MHNYRAPRWLAGHGPVGGNLQTIWPALFSRSHQGPAPAYRRERWPTPDQDFIDVDFGALPDDESVARPLLVLFHGLEGSSASHYARAFANWARENGWRYAVPHFRGCSGELNLAPRAYHSGDHEEIGWVLRRMREIHHGPIVAVGVSLGGNALLRWAEEAGETASQTVRAVCAISSPIDLAAGGHAIGSGFNRQVYTRMFLRSMVPKALRKLAQHPGLFDGRKLQAARDLYDFDNIFTAPLHGFRSTEDYWARGSAKPHLHRIRIPALLLNALNDPFVPAASLPKQHEVGAFVTLWQPQHGGHVGFARGRWPGHVLTLPEQVMGWMGAHTGEASQEKTDG
ncbi:MAG: alpha/beta fold hydrolase [Cytophagales bacterium]|nr:alpha/beta fold hydrolase [Rhizobacter sp.]